MTVTEQSAAQIATRAIQRARACRGDACQQGRKACPCPQACEWPDPEDRNHLRDWAAWVIVAVLGTIAVAYLAAACLH